MSFASTSCSTSAFGSAPETSASPPVLAKGTASEVRMATRIRKDEFRRREGHEQQAGAGIDSCSCCLLLPLALHRGEKFRVGLRLLEALEHDFHLLDR